ncbi:MAG: hypothetical protein ACP5T2_00890 [Thermoprotei archaeon]
MAATPISIYGSSDSTASLILNETTSFTLLAWGEGQFNGVVSQ